MTPQRGRAPIKAIDSPTDCLIALGSNLGDRTAFLEWALVRMSRLPGTELIAASSFHETEPVGGPPQGPFLNAAARLQTTLDPHALWRALVRIEREAGRERLVACGPRTLDLDIVLYGDQMIETPDLTIPHPRAHERRFVLAPAVEIAGSMVHPVLHCTLAEALRRL
jgi:2-amino-4-hydroxy-6-hydroxymethyldihydropteridine diphosphokinase